VADLLGMQRAVWRSTRSTTEKIVLLAILDFYSDSSPQPWPSVATLAVRTSLGRTAVLDALASLEGNGVVTVRRVAGRPNHYDLSRIVAVLTAPAPVRQTDGSLESPELEAEPEPTAAVEQPVRDVDRSATQTSPPPGRDQSAWRTRRIPRSNQRRKPLSCARERRPNARKRCRCRSPNAPDSCSTTLAQPSSCSRSVGQKHDKSRKPMVAPSAANARCRKSRVIPGFARFSCCSRPSIRWTIWRGLPATCRNKPGGAAATACVA
jgi:hypothetical protein